MIFPQSNYQGKQHGYNDNYQAGVDDRYEIVRRPYSDLRHNQYFPLPRLPPPRLPSSSRLPIRRVDDEFDRYNENKHWVRNLGTCYLRNFH